MLKGEGPVEAEELLCRPVLAAVYVKFGGLAETKRAAIPHILRGENVLISSPTGTSHIHAFMGGAQMTLFTSSIKRVNRHHHPIPHIGVLQGGRKVLPVYSECR
jgi:hypothetical protein